MQRINFISNLSSTLKDFWYTIIIQKNLIKERFWKCLFNLAIKIMKHYNTALDPFKLNAVFSELKFFNDECKFSWFGKNAVEPLDIDEYQWQKDKCDKIKKLLTLWQILTYDESEYGRECLIDMLKNGIEFKPQTQLTFSNDEFTVVESYNKCYDEDETDILSLITNKCVDPVENYQCSQNKRWPTLSLTVVKDLKTGDIKSSEAFDTNVLKMKVYGKYNIDTNKFEWIDKPYFEHSYNGVDYCVLYNDNDCKQKYRTFSTWGYLNLNSEAAKKRFNKKKDSFPLSLPVINIVDNDGNVKTHLTLYEDIPLKYLIIFDTKFHSSDSYSTKLCQKHNIGNILYEQRLKKYESSGGA